jgi:hypothetical protein
MDLGGVAQIAREHGGKPFGSTPSELAVSLGIDADKVDILDVGDDASLQEIAATIGGLGSSLARDILSIKQSFRQEAKQCEKEDMSKRERLRTWASSQVVALLDSQLTCPFASAGAHCIPTGEAVLDWVDWVPPGALLAKGILSDQPPHGKFIQELLASWHERHKPIVANETPPLAKTKRKISLCSIAGLCLCGRVGFVLRQMVSSFQRTLQEWLQKGSELREWYDRGLLYVQLTSSEGENSVFCLAYLNYNNHRGTLMQFEQVHGTPESIAAEARGRILCCHDGDLQAMACRNFWKTFNNYNKIDVWKLRFLHAHDGDALVGKFEPATVELVQFRDMPATTWWAPSGKEKKVLALQPPPALPAIEDGIIEDDDDAYIAPLVEDEDTICDGPQFPDCRLQHFVCLLCILARTLRTLYIHLRP